MSYQEQLTDFLRSAINGLLNRGVNQVVISPGSRSTPLALLLHQSEDIETFIGVDERSSAFLALGLSKASQQPVALLCTSGTAAANYYPAICEAMASHVPLIVLTTDRPHELRHVGAPQTMNQTDLFGEHTKAFIDMSLPDNTEVMLDYAFWQVARLTDVAMQLPKGPVQINFPLREPLLPDLERQPVPMPNLAVIAGEAILSDATISDICDQLQSKKGVIVVGGEKRLSAAAELVALADALQWPIIGDPLTNLVSCGHVSDCIMSHSDLFIPYVTQSKPEVVLRFGKLPISKEVMLWLDQLTLVDTPMYLVDELGGWEDQLKRSQVIIQASEQWFVQKLLATTLVPTDTNWLAEWKNWQKITKTVIAEHAIATDLTEPAVALTIHETMADFGQLFVSNSMAIRHLDRFTSPREQAYKIFGNRGVNGIDGVVSTAMGMALMNPNHSNLLLIGDLAMYHDMNGLMWAKHYSIPLTIVLVNNNGGGIFSYLSQQSLTEEDFEPLFGTPIDLDGRTMAQLYGADYQEATTVTELRDMLTLANATPGFRVIEVKTSRPHNVLAFNHVKEAIKEAVTCS